jgi:hypothetical protein
MHIPDFSSDDVTGDGMNCLLQRSIFPLLRTYPRLPAAQPLAYRWSN